MKSGSHSVEIAGSEQLRLSRLRRYRILDTPVERDFNDIASLAADLCRTPIALVSLVDDERQWFKARVGLDVCETPRSSSFCAHAMHESTVMEVPDARADARFARNPLVVGEPFIRFYAGAPLITPDGVPLGTLCVIDRRPRRLTDSQRDGLLTLARHVMIEFELRSYQHTAEEAGRQLAAAERVKDEFLARVTHELRTPLASIQGYLEALDEGDLPPGATSRFMDAVRRNSDRLLTLVDDMMLAARLECGEITLCRQRTDLAQLAATAAHDNRALAAAKGLTLSVEAAGPVFADVDAVRIAQALDRLVLNAIKFTTAGSVVVRAGAHEGRASLEVADTGIGMSEEERQVLFRAFRRSRAAEETEVQGVGLGLTIVKSIIDRHGGQVTAADGEGSGTTVTITLPGPQTASDPGRRTRSETRQVR